ncbi:MAG: EthD family reductase [Flavobacteriaceae bacterium]
MKIKFILLALVAVTLFVGWQPSSSKTTSKIKKGMIKVAIMYPNEEGKTFNMDYYTKKHMPMCATLFGDSLQLLQIDKGIAGRTPDEPIPYIAIGYFYFNKLSEYQSVFGPNAEQIVGDIPNYTDIQPVVQISEVME